MDEALARRVEEQLLRIAYIDAVAIDHSDHGIEAIHVLAQDLRRPKQIVRDVLSSLRTVFNLTVDHKKVSVVCQSATDRGRRRPGHPMEGGRPTVVSVAVRDSRAGVETEVVLGLGGRETMGVARGPGSGLRRMRVAAEATTRALERFIDEAYRVEVGEIRDLDVGGRRAVVVTVSIVSGRDESALVGVAWAADDIHRAAVNAVLDAVNRSFVRLPAREHVDYEVGPVSGREAAAG